MSVEHFDRGDREPLDDRCGINGRLGRVLSDTGLGRVHDSDSRVLFRYCFTHSWDSNVVSLFACRKMIFRAIRVILISV